MALGADTVNSARGMMLSLGCIQARTCNTDHCPTGIATQNASRNKAIIVTDKSQRVANFQRETVKNLVELVGSAGLNGVHELKPKHVNRRVEGVNIKSYEQLYPTIESNSLLNDASIPESWRYDMTQANATSW
jgi:glutamate synthase domain-containing protein 2